MNINYLSAFENILKVLPDTKNVGIVVGTSPVSEVSEGSNRQAGWNLLQTELTFHGQSELPFEELLKQASGRSRRTLLVSSGEF